MNLDPAVSWIPKKCVGEKRHVKWTKNWTAKTQMKDDYQDDERFYKSSQFLPANDNERVGWLKKIRCFLEDSKNSTGFLSWKHAGELEVEAHFCEGLVGAAKQTQGWVITGAASYWPPNWHSLGAFHDFRKDPKKNMEKVTISTFRFFRKLRNKELLAIQRMCQLFLQTCQNIGGTIGLHPRNLIHRYQKTAIF